MPRSLSIPMLLVVLASAACESSHPATKTAEAYLQAAQYGDVEGMWSRHVESTRQSVYCESDSFANVLAEAKKAADPGECGRIRELGAGDLEKLPDEARFLVQVVGFVCESDDATCGDYARFVFERQVRRDDVFGAVEKFEVRKVIGEEKKAAAYVDLHVEGGVEHRTLSLRKVGDGWLVYEGWMSK